MRIVKNVNKNERGVTITALAIAIIIIGIIVSIVIYNVSGNIKTAELKNMQNDIENLKDKIEIYYSKNGTLPIINCEYTNISQLGDVIGENDSNKFYVIDLSKLDNLTLNYGKEFTQAKALENPTTEAINVFTDIYVINQRSHNVFYVAGIKIGDKTFYTNYNQDNKDMTQVTQKSE